MYFNIGGPFACHKMKYLSFIKTSVFFHLLYDALIKSGVVEACCFKKCHVRLLLYIKKIITTLKEMGISCLYLEVA